MRRNTLRKSLSFAAIALLAATLAGCAGEYWWFLELFAHFRPHYVAVAILLTVASITACHLPGIAVSLTCLALNGVPVVSFFGQSVPNRAGHGEILKIVSANIGGGSGDNNEEIIALIHDHQPDVLLLLELTPAALVKLQSTLDNAYPHDYAIPRSDYFGIGLFSRYPLEDRDLVDLGYKDVPAISTRISIGQSVLHLVGVHLEWPMTASSSQGRNSQVEQLASRLSDSDGATVLVGDFNLTRWVPRFTDLQSATGLRDTAIGFGWQPTWPTMLPKLGIAIDHCLASPSLHIKSSRPGPHIGSDHYPLIVEIEL